MVIFAQITTQKLDDMANALMFEVGVKKANDQLDEIKREIESLVKLGKNGIDIKVRIEDETRSLQNFLNLLNQIGDGKQIKDLKSQVDNLLASFSKIGIQASGIDMSALKKQLDLIDNTYAKINEKTAELKAKGSDGLTITNQTSGLRVQLDAQLKTLSTKFNMTEEAARNIVNSSKEVESSTRAVVTSLSGEGSAAQEAVQKLNALVTEKQSVVEAEKKLAENSQLTTKTLENEGAQANNTAKQIQNVGQAATNSTNEETDAANKASKAEENRLKLIADIESVLKRIGNLSASGNNAALLGGAESQFRGLLQNVSNLEVGGSISVLKATFSRLKAEYKDVIQESDNLARTLKNNNATIQRDSERTAEAQKKSLSDTNVEMQRLENVIARLNTLKLDAIAAKVDTSNIDNLINVLNILKNNDFGAISKGKGIDSLGNMFGDIKSAEDTRKTYLEINKVFGETSRQIRENVKSEKEAERARKESQKASEKAVNEEKRRAAIENKSINDAYIKYNQLGAKLNELQRLKNRGVIANIDTHNIDAYINYLEKLRSVMEGIFKNKGRTIDSESLSFFGLKQGQLTKDFLGENNVKSKEFFGKNRLSAFKRELADAEQRMASAGKTADNLGRHIDNLEAKRVDFKGLDTTRFDNAIQKIRDIKAELERFATTGVSSHGNSSKEIVHNMGLAAAKKEASDATKQLGESSKLASQSINQLSESEIRLANSVGKTSSEMRGQSQVLSDLKMMAMQYISVWGAQSFVNSIIETGGLLEQQRLSLSAILGDMGKAQTLFNQIKTMALKSPFGVVELDKMSKQLAAYSFEYEELFEWTKRLADISAATGTSVDRLALALGHVRSEGALSGYTLRQFAMANVPVLRMLSENLGVSSKEVRDRVRKKEISAEDVQNILKQLTDDGGMFANAQETMSEALNAKFKNLRDAFDIMYGEIAESGIGDKLKELAVILTNGAKHWERLAKDIVYVATAFGIGKVAMYAYNAALGRGAAMTLKSALAAKRQEVINLKLAASYRKLTAEEEFNIATSSKLNSRNIAALLSTKKLTIAELERLVALKKVDKEVALAALRINGLSVAEMQNVRVLSLWARGWEMLKYNLRTAGLAIKGFIASAWPLVALTAAFEIWNRRSEQKENAKDMAGAMAGTARGKEAYEINSSLADARKLSKDALIQNIEEMVKALSAADAYTKELKEQVDATDDLIKKYDLLKNAIGKVSEKYEEQKRNQENMLNEAWDAGGGFLSDNMLTDTEQFDAAMAEYQKKITIASKQIKSVLSEWLKNQGQFKSDYAEMTGKQIFEDLSKDMQKSFLSYAWNANGLDDVTQNMLRDVSRSYAKVSEKLSEMSGEQGQQFASIMKAMYEEAFKVDLDKAGDEQKIAFDKWLRETLGRAEKLSQDAKEALRNIVIDFTIKLVPSYQIVKPRTPDQVVTDELGDNQWLGNFFRRNNKNTLPALTEEATKQLTDRYKKVLGNISLSNIDSAQDDINKQLDKLEDSNKRLVKSLDKGNLSDAEKNKLRETKKKNDEDIQLLNEALSDIGGDRVRKKKKGSGGSTEDKNAKAVRERVRVIKEAADAFEYWKGKVGDEKAWSHVVDEFGDVLKTINVTAENIEDLKSNLSNIKTLRSYKLIKDQKVKTEIDKEIAKELDKINRKDFEKKTEEFLSNTKIELDSLTRSWELFNSVREATGNVDIALNISGVDYDGEKNRNLADAVKKKIESDFASAGVIDVEFNTNLSDEEISDMVKKSMPKESEERIKAFVEQYKKWRDLQRDVVKNDITTFAKLLGSSKAYDDQIRKINNNLSIQLESIDNIQKPDGVSDEEFEKWKNTAKAIANATAESEKFKLGYNYINLMNNSAGMTIKAIHEAANEVRKNLVKQLENGVITAQEFADQMEKIHKLERDAKLDSFFGMNNIFGNFMKGGAKGVVSFLDKAINARVVELKEKGEYTTDKNGKYNGNDKALIDLIGKREKWEGFMQDMSGFMLAVDIATGAIDGMVKATQSLSDMFDALGKEGAAATWSDISDAIKAVGSPLSPVSNIAKSAMNGDVAGIVSNAISAPIEMFTAPITAFAKLHDKKRERQLNELKKEVQKVDNTLNLIKNLRGNTLGYDTGELRRLLAAQYQNTTTEGGQAMYEYYSRGGLEGSGYKQELEAMKEQRRMYEEMYETEKDKKKSSSEALEEYKVKMAELDITIQNFASNIANELYGLDLEGWATQIGDALMTAFENGEDAAKAFKNTVEDIMRQVLRKMLSLGVIQPMMERLQKKLFGENGKGGVFDASNPEGTIDDTMKAIAEFFGEGGEGRQAIDATKTFAEGWERVMKNYGLDLKDYGSNSSASNSIKTITEQTADLLASYVNATRASTAKIEYLQAQYFPMFYAAVTGNSSNLRNIENHTSAIMRSNDIIADKITSLDSNITGLKNKAWKMPIA